MKKIIPIVILGLALAACAGSLPGFKNPVRNVDMFRVKATYGAAVELSVKWREACFGTEAAPLTYVTVTTNPLTKPICTNRRTTLRAIMNGDDKAYDAIAYAENFVKNNPTIDVTSVIGPAWDAVVKFQKAVPPVPGI
jgi:hypothetical protein